MNRNLILFLLGICFSLPTFSQKSPKPKLSETYQIQWGREQNTKKRPAEYIGTDKAGNHIYHAYREVVVPILFYVVLQRREYLQVYDKDMKFLRNERIPGLDDLKGSNWSQHKILRREFIKFNGKHYVLTKKAKGKWRKGHVLTISEFNLDHRTLGKAKNLFSYKNGLDGKYEMIMSPDASKLMFYYEASTSYRSKAKYKYYLFDETLEIMDRGSVRFQGGSDYVEVQSALLDNSGKFAFLSRHRKTKRELKRERRKRKKQLKELFEPIKAVDYHIYLGQAHDKEVIHVPFDVEGRIIGGISLCHGLDSTIKVLGTFQGKSKDHYRSNLTQYLFSADLSYGGKIRNLEMEDEVATTKKVLSRRERKALRKKEAELRGVNGHVYFTDVLYDNDSNYYLVGEYYHRFTYTQTSTNGAVSSATRNVRGAIQVLKYTRDGKLLWKQSIYKEWAHDVGGVSFRRISGFKPFLNSNGELFLLYEDNASYTDNRQVKYEKTRTDRTGYFLARLDPANGKLEKHLIGSTYFSNRFYMPKINEAQKRDDGNIMITGYRGWREQKTRVGVIIIN